MFDSDVTRAVHNYEYIQIQYYYGMITGNRRGAGMTGRCLYVYHNLLRLKRQRPTSTESNRPSHLR
jgi:hypothetical protein